MERCKINFEIRMIIKRRNMYGLSNHIGRCERRLS